jgi:hypothetical protein
VLSSVVVSAFALAPPALAARTTSERSIVSSLANSIKSAVVNTVKADLAQGLTQSQIEKDVHAAIALIIVQSGADPSEVSAALAEAQSLLASDPTMAGASVSIRQAFNQVRTDIRDGTIKTASNGQGNQNGQGQNGNGQGQNGSGSGSGGGGGGGYRNR